MRDPTIFDRIEARLAALETRPDLAEPLARLAERMGLVERTLPADQVVTNTASVGAAGALVTELGSAGSTSTVLGKLVVNEGLGVFGHAPPAAQHGAIAAVTNPGAFKKGASGYETEAEAKAVIEKLEALTTAVNALREVLKEDGFTA